MKAMRVTGKKHKDGPAVVTIIRQSENTMTEIGVKIDGRMGIDMKEGNIERGQVVVDIEIRNVHLGEKKGNTINVVVGHLRGREVVIGTVIVTGIGTGTEIAEGQTLQGGNGRRHRRKKVKSQKRARLNRLHLLPHLYLTLKGKGHDLYRRRTRGCRINR